jgi:hypothetical protein
VTRPRLALAAGLAVAGTVAAVVALAWRHHAAAAARPGGATGAVSGWWTLALLVAAFAAYLAGLALLRRAPARLTAVLALAAAVQLAPLGAPLLLSTDAWTYWDYGRLAAVHDANPYIDTPQAFPADPAYRAMGSAWRDQTSVYGPAFTLASEPLALAAGSSRDAAAWEYKTLAALGALAAAVLAAVLARRRALAAAFVGWNPVLAVHLAGGGHNDAWIGLLSLAALALAAARRPLAAGGVWALAVAVKWVPLVFLLLRALAARARREPLGAGSFAATAAAVVALASWRYGSHWLDAFAPLAQNVRLETSYALPHRLQGLGVPRDVALAVAITVLVCGLALLCAAAARGRARPALAACLLLATTPYLAVWYLGWAVPLAAADDDDRLARAAALALTAYLLPETIPH